MNSKEYPDFNNREPSSIAHKILLTGEEEFNEKNLMELKMKKIF